jgi:hypothetical protein
LKVRISKRTSRNVYWKRIVAKHGFRIEVLKEFVNEQVAHSYEKTMIAHYRSIGQAEANICDGGEGTTGLRFNHSDATKRKIGQSGIGRIGYFKGKKLSAETKEKMSMIRRTGSKQEAPKSTHPQRRNRKAQLYLSPTGESFATSYEASKFAGVAPSTIRFWAKNNKFGWTASKKGLHV